MKIHDKEIYPEYEETLVRFRTMQTFVEWLFQKGYKFKTLHIRIAVWLDIEEKRNKTILDENHPFPAYYHKGDLDKRIKHLTHIMNKWELEIEFVFQQHSVQV